MKPLSSLIFIFGECRRARKSSRKSKCLQIANSNRKLTSLFYRTPQMVEFRSWQRKDENPISTHHSTIFPGAHYDDMARDTGTGTVTGTGSNQTTESEEEMKNRMFLNFDTTNRFTEESLSFTSAEELTVLASTRGNVFAGGMSQMQYSLASLVSTPLTDPLSFFSPMEQAPFGSNDNLSGNARKNPVGKPLSKRPRSQLSEECLQIIKKYKKNDLSVSPTPLNMQDLEARRSARSNPREWRILQHNLTKDEALEVLKYHRWKEPVTNAPKGAGCRVSQCGLHSGCQHLLKMRYNTLLSTRASILILLQTDCQFGPYSIHYRGKRRTLWTSGEPQPRPPRFHYRGC